MHLSVCCTDISDIAEQKCLISVYRLVCVLVCLFMCECGPEVGDGGTVDAYCVML